MQKSLKHKIVIIGCGNVAWHIAKHFSQLKKFDIEVYNHKVNKLLNDFKTKLKCSIKPNFDKINLDADYYFICVTDKFISATAKKIKIQNKNALLIHTSGSAKLSELGNLQNAAVFYPLQSFSKNDEVNWKETPIIIEAKNEELKKQILVLTNYFSKNIYSLNYKERLKLHLAAVLVNNFTNALFVVASNLITKESASKDIKILLPLIKQTVSKIVKMNPLESQT
ncbi:MAG: DUF2520 domain-containing protein, partial [Bacteroidota bacterium]